MRAPRLTSKLSTEKLKSQPYELAQLSKQKMKQNSVQTHSIQLRELSQWRAQFHGERIVRFVGSNIRGHPSSIKNIPTSYQIIINSS